MYCPSSLRSGVCSACVALGSKVPGLRRLLPSTVLWQLIVFLLLSLWFYPFYAIHAS
jgi:hypothetical protein